MLAATALAVGIGATTAIYSVVNAVMLKPLPYRDGDRFVAVFGAATSDPEHYSHLQGRDAQAYQERTRVFDAFGWFREAGKNLTFAGQPHHIQGVMVTPALAHQLGVDPLLGQWFQDERGVVISTSLWRRLGSDPGIIGKPLTLDGASFTVTGVMPASFHLPVAGVTSAGVRTDVWMPLDPRESGGGYVAYGRRKPGITLAAADADVKRVAAEIAADDPVNHPAYTARLFDLRETVIKDIRPTLLLLFAAAALLFLITCANAAGLLLARSVARARETAVRVALGAGRRQLAAQYFAEGLIGALAGAAGGVFLSITLTPAIVAMAGDYLPRAGEIGVDWTVLLFALSAAFLATALSSLAPLWQAVRTTPADALGDGARATAGARGRRVSQLLVVAEVALAFGLLAISALLIIHLRNLARVSPGFDVDDLLTFALSVPGPVAADPAKRVTLQRRLVDALQTIPGVGEVAFANQLPLDGCCLGTNIYPEGRPADGSATHRMSLMAASPGYVRAMRIPLRAGRVLTEQDAIKGLILVVINEAAAKRYWNGQDPVGAHGRFDTPTGARFRVIGVVGDIKNDGLGNPTVPEVHLLGSIPRIETMHFVVRSTLPAASLVPAVTRVIRTIDPDQPIHDVATMREIIQRTVTLERVASLMTAFFAAAALLLAMLGVYGVVSYSVRQRTVEIGTRMALGATSRGVLALIVTDGVKMAAYGVAFGGLAAIAGVFYLARWFRIETLGPAPFLFSTSIVAVVAFAASFIPAWRASALSPMVAIRNQPESMWRAARLTVRRAMRELSTGAERPVVALAMLISEFAGALRRTSSFPDALKEVLATLRERTGAQSIVLLEKAPGDDYRGGGIAIAARGIVINRLRHYPHPLTLTAADFETWLRWAREFRPEHAAEIEALEKTGVRIVIPLRAKHEIVGVVLLGPPAGRDSFTTTEKDLLGSSAEVFALLIENVRLSERALEQEKLRRDLALAAEVQRRLLPAHPPRCGSATLAAFTLAARTVGGDYYDFFELPGDRIALAVADISGKGVAAALLMSVVQASLRVISTEGADHPSELVARMNRFVYGSTGNNKYATFFYAQLEDGARRLRYINAGHNPPYLTRRTVEGVETIELSTGGTVLGLFPDVAYEDAAVELRPGDLLVVYTDGVTEALDVHGEEFGEERLKRLLNESLGVAADEVAATLAAALRHWIAGTEQYDDLTFIVVSVN